MKYLRTITIVLCVCCVAAFAALYIRSHSQEHAQPSLKIKGATLTLSSEELGGSLTPLMEGVTASDKQDGDLTDAVTCTPLSAVETDEGMQFSVRYTVFDSDGYSDQKTRHVVVTDYTGPRIQTLSPLVFSAAETADPLLLLTAEDALDGDCTNRIRLSASALSDQPGIYFLPAEVTSSVGVTRFVTLPAIVRSDADSSITIPLTKSVVYLTAGSSFDAAAYVARSNTTDYTADTDSLDMQTPGTYYVTYTNTEAAARDVSSTAANSQTILTVVVE